ncbi:hypothetical protein [Gordonia westfalica]|uniref:Uncharacterized protein n=1 Tax=Gordonia westfalica TaxID=158898 RepID=A0A1H2J3C8_9ACTN|nr:hypothetical protein [Gordonia westfalica]SDU50890.1 hypothetical protein SAMN04488548_1341688 [Gordonia westfalica]
MSAPETSGDRDSDAVDLEKDAVEADLQAAEEDVTVEVEATEEDATVEIAPGETSAEIDVEDVAPEEAVAEDEAAPVEEAPATEEATAEEATAEESAEEEIADAADLEGLHVSSRVRVTLEDGTTREGEIVDDFADLAPGDQTVEARIDDDHIARLRRWAISTDDHDIVFADDDAVELISV